MLSLLLSKAGQRPFFTPQMQQVRPRWQPMHSQQQVRPPGMQGMPGAGQVPRARGIRQVPPRGVPGQQQPGGAGGPSQRVGGMGQAQVRGPGGMQGQGQRPSFKFRQNVRNQPAKRHPWAVPMQPQEQVPQTIQIPVSVIASILWTMIISGLKKNSIPACPWDNSIHIFLALGLQVLFCSFNSDGKWLVSSLAHQTSKIKKLIE